MWMTISSEKLEISVIYLFHLLYLRDWSTYQDEETNLGNTNVFQMPTHFPLATSFFSE